MNNVNKRSIAITSLVILLPALAGVVLWNRLPERVATHFNFSGTADGWSGKAFAVFFMPLFMLAVHFICVFGTTLDPKNQNTSGKIRAVILWICPAASLFTGIMIYANALGYAMDNNRLGLLFIGAVFLITGNYLPKCRQNYTIGIKLPWTLADEENWNRTHRMAGPLWAAGGLILLLDAFLGIAPAVIMLAVTVVVGIAPVVFSLALYLRAGRQSADDGM